MNYLAILLCLGVALVFTSASPAGPNQGTAKKVVCYYGSWAVYRPGNGKFDVEEINPMICTHFVYGFSGLNEDSTLKILDEYNELEENWGRGAMRRFTNMKQQNPAAKFLLAVGGWNEGSELYSKMAETAESRKSFIESVIPFLIKYNFDGFDLDWEYPTQRGGRPIDQANFILLCQELRAAFDPVGLLLTAAVSAGVDTIRAAYDIPGMSRYLDFISVMAYDFHGAWEDFTHHHSPHDQIPQLDAANNFSDWNCKRAIEFWIEQGAPPSKIILGMGTYGRGKMLDDTSNTGFYAKASQPLSAGPYTREAGILGYNEILEKFASEKWEVFRNVYVVAPYAVSGRQWIGYDDVESIAFKSNWINELGLGGGMFWSIETDDFRGIHSSESFPLVKTAYRILVGQETTPRPTTIGTTDPTATATTGATSVITSTGSPTGPPTTPPSDGACHAPGPMRDPTNCRQFFVCVADGDDKYHTITYPCPTGTIYDPAAQFCNWYADVPGAADLCNE